MSAPLTVLIVDDEPLARRGVRVRLERAGEVEVVGECESGREAVRAIAELGPDLVFLDVQMPGMDGFEVIERVGGAMPPVVFVTAFDQHALRAFDAAALDYLLKPIDDERFGVMLARARQRVAERRLAAGAPAPARLLVRERGRVAFVDPAEIRWVEARGDYVRLHLADRTHLLRETIGALERRLPPEGFVRVHRSALVRARAVAGLEQRSSRDWSVVLEDGTRIKLSRRHRAELDARLEAARAESG
ncbi:MAG: LytTR family DNA-binding domain-containing protein [Gemmatimonadales bacterium]